VAFHQAGYEVVAIDFSEAALQAARATLGVLYREVALPVWETLRLRVRAAELRSDLRTSVSLLVAAQAAGRGATPRGALSC
jgi:hypothetical protein